MQYLVEWKKVKKNIKKALTFLNDLNIIILALWKTAKKTKERMKIRARRNTQEAEEAPLLRV